MNERSAMHEHCAALRVHGETLWLHPQRAVWWPARRTVIVADTHFGKSALFGRHGVAVPAGSDQHDRERLTRLIEETGAARLLILGDFLHAPLEAASAEAHDLRAWAEGMRGTEICVIAGNHDRGSAGLWAAALQSPERDVQWLERGVRWQDRDLLEPPFRFTHDAGRVMPGAELSPDDGFFTLSGHIHPVMRLGGLRKRAPRVPVFWQRESGLVLPSFGVFTGGAVVQPDAGDHVFAVGSQSVVRFY
jgi:DNA ligase-associated metallophosphoesterase